ncbi:patatin-like phospholipase family protein [Leptospira terpstrae]|uniref:Phospholipase, patatin family n=1 Tax=Leptospira terpstrae serovar Hualin str. LT 11-33 = ATCC 700639 TaxID=1257025 RepID=N1VUS6_9LEPT|nr:patatin-like phospholipase family protein [Leptospira terpstrae]EMY60747.1 phospholipase, patatin family [Leptospira terpstrae serovar Hualin str. LT 11-33 = ATCC 700639]
MVPFPSSNESSNHPKLPKAKGSKRALLVEGGGMKGAFSGGVLYAWNRFLRPNYFDLVVGVSSGACAAAYYVSMPKEEPVKSEKALAVWYRDLSGSKLISFFHPFQGKTLLNQEYLIDFIFRKKVRLESETLDRKNVPHFAIAVSNLHTHSIEYIKATSSNIFDLLKAATSLPIATRGKHWLNGKLYSDAAILNPLPIQDIIEAGYKEIVVIMNSPIRHISGPLTRFTSLLAFPKHRAIRRLMRKLHHFHFNSARELAVKPPRGVKIITVAPDAPLPVKLTTTIRTKLYKTVLLGAKKGEEAMLKILKRKPKKQK